MNYLLHIECLSDTCFSRPVPGQADVDAEPAVDQLGLPIVPGKTLHGILRDAWLSIQPYFDEDRSLGHALLGAPGQHDNGGVLRIGSAALNSITCTQIASRLTDNANFDHGAVRDAFYNTRVFTSIDRATGAPMTDTLRTIRVVPPGTRFTLTLSTSRALSPAEADLLTTLTGITRHAGLGRNRGMGHVKLTLVPVERKAPEKPSGRIANGKAENSVVFLPYRLTLTAPALFRSSSSDANSCSTLRFVPGSAIRGSFAAELEQRIGVGDVNAAEMLDNLIAGEGARFLNAYPEVGEYRSTPTPITWQQSKGEAAIDRQAHPRDGLVEVASEPGDHEFSGGEQRIKLQAEFVTLPGSRSKIANPVRASSTLHQTRKRATGSTVKGETTVFMYESLEAGQTFQGLVAVPRNYVGEVGKVLRSGMLWLGRSARSGYGGAPQIVPLQPRDAEHVERYSIERGGLFKATLSSPAIVRDATSLQPDPWSLEAELSARFSACAEMLFCAVRHSEARGYNRLWRTELPQYPAAAAGSTALLRAIRDISEAELAHLASEPLGDRIADGYGCIIIERCNAELGEREPLHLDAASDTHYGHDVKSIRDIDSLSQLTLAQRRVYRKRLRTIYASEALAILSSGDSIISASLFQRLRSPLRDSGSAEPGADQALTGWRSTYLEWLNVNPGAGKCLTRDTLRKLDRVCLTVGQSLPSLKQFLTAAASDAWAPDESTEQNEMRRRCRLLAAAESDAIWQATRRDLAPFFIDTLLGGLAKRAARRG